jgi:general secretion pathway protein E
MTDYMKMPPQSRLEMISLAEGLTRAGRLSAKDLVRLKSMRQMRLAPLPFLAEQKLSDLSGAGDVLDMGALLGFLSQETELGVFDIDPLKIDTKSVADVMSEAFAERHQILAVAVDDIQVTIATSEPWVTGWIRDLEHATRRPIRRVLADPRDIARYTKEFYVMARSVQGANTLNRGEGGNLANLEAMVQLGGKSELDANDQHVVSVVDWLLQYAFEQRASDIHIEFLGG